MNSDNFEGPILDEIERKVYVIATCPPLGRTCINIGTEAINVRGDFTEPDSDGMSELITHTEVDDEILQASIAAMEPLWDRWDVLWPIIYEAMLSIRKNYGYQEPITADNAKMTITPPCDSIDYEAENWTFELEIEPWDGWYFVEFELDGTIVESDATF